MPEHLIRLRGGWEWLDQAGGPARRLTLPARWPIGLEGPVHLARKFGRPPFDPGSEALRLELRDVPGLVSLRLNGAEVARPEGSPVDWVVPLDELPGRNEVIIEVDPIRAGPHERWGSIALVVAEVAGGPIIPGGGPLPGPRPFER